MTQTIYAITDTRTDTPVYVGSCLDLLGRIRRHFYRARKLPLGACPVHYHMNEQGIEHFEIERLGDTDGLLTEEWWIEHLGTFRNGLNRNKSGRAGQPRKILEAFGTDKVSL